MIADGLAESAARSSKSPPALTSGAVVDGRYEVTLALGAGGMGEVYEVIHRGLRKPFALKCLKEGALDDARAAQRFMKEIRGLATVHSDFVVSVCDCGQLASGAPYFVMERLRGQDLRKLLCEVDSLAPVRAIKLAIDACMGLHAVHEAGLVHRDLKPENLFVTSDADGGERCKVLDFGIAKLVGTGSTKRHSLLGTLKYMAPEQMVDASSVGPATDIYSLGAVLYECLTGRPPHVAETEPELMFKIMNTQPMPITAFVPTLDANLTSVVERALRRDPERRYASAFAFAGALASCLVAYNDEAENNDLGEQTGPRAVAFNAIRPRAWIFGALALGVLLGFALRSPSYPINLLPTGAPIPRAEPVANATAPYTGSTRNSIAAPSAASSASVAPMQGHPQLPPRSGSRSAGRSVVPTLPVIDDHNPYE
jgi:serine/threonine protein kinase